MIPRHRRGRPAAALPGARHPVTRALRELITAVHAGNLREASRHAGVPYATLRELYRGETADPGLATVTRIAAAYGLPVDWFLGAGPAPLHPSEGWTGILPPDPDTGADPTRARRVVIPFAAWSLFGVAVRLERRLKALPESARRPIVGGAHEADDFRRRLTAFLLEPILAARAAGASVPLVTQPPLRGEPPLTPERREQWLDLLRKLGDYWEAVFGGD